MAAPSPLRRWKRFFPVFGTIDAAIVASQRDEEVGCAEVLREAMGDVVQLLCDAPEDDPAEELCRILDDVMAEYLITLKTVPVTSSALASTELAKAVGALEEHESEKVRGLARDIFGMWRESVQSEIAAARARVEELRKLSDQDPAPPKSRRPSVVGDAAADGEKRKQVKDASWATKAAIRSSNLVERAKSNVPEKVSAPLPKKIAPVVCAERANAVVNMDKKMVPSMKMPAIVGNGGRDRGGIDRMEAAKRKLRTGYQEAEDAKRQRKIVVIEAPNKQQQPQRKMVEQQPRRKVHPIIRERSQARCATSTAARSSLMPSLVL